LEMADRAFVGERLGVFSLLTPIVNRNTPFRTVHTGVGAGRATDIQCRNQAETFAWTRLGVDGLFDGWPQRFFDTRFVGCYVLTTPLELNEGCIQSKNKFRR
jgi:hypothetical protein